MTENQNDDLKTVRSDLAKSRDRNLEYYLSKAETILSLIEDQIARDVTKLEIVRELILIRHDGWKDAYEELKGAIVQNLKETNNG